MEINDVFFDTDGNIIDILSEKILKDTPEERVRQGFIKILIEDYNYPKALIRREVPIQSGSAIMHDREGNEIRSDIVIYTNKNAASSYDQGNILFIVECKQPKVTDGYNQMVSYIYNTSAAGGVWTNGDSINIFRKKESEVGLEEILSLPRFKEKNRWYKDTARIPFKSELQRPKNIRFLLSSCHNKLYGRGMENEDFDLAMDMVRILLAKIQDETKNGATPSFWITNDEFQSTDGRKAVAETIQRLFREYADQYPDVFDPHERIQVGADCIVEAVGILQTWNLAARNDDVDDWDLMGETYEQFTHINLKRQQGQFFTNRLVVNMMVKMLDPQIGEHALDPAGGSGGFATAIFRYLRRKVIEHTESSSPVRDRQLANIKDSVYLVEIASRLVKIAKCAMLLTGDGQSGMTRGNSLAEYNNLDPWILSRCYKGKSNAPTVIATNPPFSGQKIESQVSDRSILRLFEFGHSFQKGKDEKYYFSTDDDNILPRQAPELLFLERCIDWVKPGGRIGIVMPKGFLDNISYEAYRQWLFDKCILNAVVTLHKDTFQPDTGVRTCVLFLTKLLQDQTPPADYTIFMAQSQRIGQDSKGKAVYILDRNGNSTGILNQDLDEIATAYYDYTHNRSVHPSEYIFTINRANIKDHNNINPQHYSPRLNKSIENILSFNEKSGWSVTTIGQLEAGIKIFMGPRWNASNLKIERPVDTRSLVPYLTANGALELRRFTIKWIDPSKATAEQKVFMKMLKVNEGDILITRSGTIGKVTYATKNLAETYLISDDLVRVRVQDDKLRAYLLSYFTSSTALSLMLLDEYGSVQQHLQPRHIQEMLVPIPDHWASAVRLIEAGQQLIQAMELLSKSDENIRLHGFDSMIDFSE